MKTKRIIQTIMLCLAMMMLSSCTKILAGIFGEGEPPETSWSPSTEEVDEQAQMPMVPFANPPSNLWSGTGLIVNERYNYSFVIPDTWIAWYQKFETPSQNTGFFVSTKNRNGDEVQNIRIFGGDVSKTVDEHVIMMRPDSATVEPFTSDSGEEGFRMENDYTLCFLFFSGEKYVVLEVSELRDDSWTEEHMDEILAVAKSYTDLDREAENE